MAERREIRVDLNKSFNRERMQATLLLASLYLSAFEILKAATVENIKSFFVFAEEVTDEQATELRKSLGEDVANQIRQSYELQVQEYEREIGVKIDERDQRGMLPSCKWLQKKGAISEDEVNTLRKIRDHRNEIAHELPNLLIGEGFELQIHLFPEMGKLLRKIELFWVRFDLQFDMQTLNEINMDEIPDEDIVSGREMLLQIITETVVEYLDKPSTGKMSN